jgi:hypothetical protein
MLFTTLLAALFAGSPLGAQQPAGGLPPEMMTPLLGTDAAADPPMMPSVPALLICHRRMLKLSDDQVRRLEAVAEGERKAVAKTAAERLRAAADLVDAINNGINLDQARAALNRLGQLRTEAVIAHLWAWKESQKILTSGQKEKITLAMTCMAGMHRMMMMRGGKGGVMLRGRAYGMGHGDPPDPDHDDYGCACGMHDDPDE